MDKVELGEHPKGSAPCVNYGSKRLSAAPMALKRGTVSAVRPENSKLFADLTFLGFLLMLGQRMSSSSDVPR